MLAVCDYNPISSSSSSHPEFELQFKEGDLIKVFGEKMPDGYYIGDVSIVLPVGEGRHMHHLSVIFSS